MKYFTIALSCFIVFISLSCQNDDFSPYGEFQNKIIMNSILDSRSNIQFVKVQHTYLPTNLNLTDSEKSSIKNLKVYFSFNNRTIFLKDTLISGVENYRILYTHELIPERGVTYTVRAESDEFSAAEATVKVPDLQYISVFIDEDNINLMYGASNTKGYLYGLYFDYEKIKNNNIEKYNVQIPLKAYADPENPDNKILEYPILTKVRGAAIPLSSLIYSLVSIAPVDTATKIKIKKAYAIVYSFDDNLYNYILSVSGFNDPYSIRLDKPFYSNIRSGFGLFGAMICDTQQFKISKDYLKAFNYIDDQN